MSFGEVGFLQGRELIALGGLLHDIGKFVQRATNKKAQEKEHFGYAHAELSYQESKRILQLFDIEGVGRELVLSSCFHHNPSTTHPEASPELRWLRALFRLADWYASTERSSLTDVENEEKYKRLRSIFEAVSLEGEAQPSIVRLSPLSLDEDVIFPKPLKEAQDYAKHGEEEQYYEYYGDYSKLWQDYNTFLENIPSKSMTSLSQKLSLLYHLMYKYTWCIPASIYDRERYHSHYPDISLFDHSRVVSALATALYTDENKKLLSGYDDSKREEFASKLKLILFEGDISGIQKFLYDITNIKGVSKRLRGRSTFLAFLPEIVGRSVLKELGYPWTSMLYVGGGKFQAVVGYEEGIEERLYEVGGKVEEALIREFGGKLGFVIYHTDMVLSDLKDYQQVIKKLMEEGQRAKKRKFSKTLMNFETLANGNVRRKVKLCLSCRWEAVEEEEETCHWCEKFAEVGGKIPKSVYVAFSSRPVDRYIDRGFHIDGLGAVYFFKEIETTSGFEDIFVINDTRRFTEDKYSTGFKFLAQSVPFEEGGSGEIKTFEELAQEANGDKKIAYVRADVDNLGLIFMKGLEGNYTVSRVATLSRSLDLFFSGYLNTLFSKEFPNKIYTVYAGGDDLFIVAPWDIAIKAIGRIREEFRYFTCHNSSFGLSAGVYITGGTYPIRLAADGAEQAELKAKSAPGKDSISILGEVLRWEELRERTEQIEEVVRRVIEKQIGRTNLYRIYMLLREYREGSEKERYMFYPFFYYYLLRNVKDERNREMIIDLFLDKSKDYEVRISALFSAKYVLMRTRDVRH